MTIDECETVLTHHGMAEVLRNRLRFMAEGGRHASSRRKRWGQPAGQKPIVRWRDSG